jgi:hypothetical protein
VGQNDQRDDIGSIRHEQDGYEQSFGLLEHFLQPSRSAIAALSLMP